MVLVVTVHQAYKRVRVGGVVTGVEEVSVIKLKERGVNVLNQNVCQVRIITSCQREVGKVRCVIENGLIVETHWGVKHVGRQKRSVSCCVYQTDNCIQRLQNVGYVGLQIDYARIICRRYVGSRGSNLRGLLHHRRVVLVVSVRYYVQRVSDQHGHSAVVVHDQLFRDRFQRLHNLRGCRHDNAGRPVTELCVRAQNRIVRTSDVGRAELQRLVVVDSERVQHVLKAHVEIVKL